MHCKAFWIFTFGQQSSWCGFQTYICTASMNTVHTFVAFEGCFGSFHFTLSFWNCTRHNATNPRLQLWTSTAPYSVRSSAFVYDPCLRAPDDHRIIDLSELTAVAVNILERMRWYRCWLSGHQCHCLVSIEVLCGRHRVSRGQLKLRIRAALIDVWVDC